MTITSSSPVTTNPSETPEPAVASDRARHPNADSAAVPPPASPPTEPHHLGSAAAQPGSFRELLWIALPLMISSGTQSIMHVLDRIFLTWHDQAELAAALPAGMLFWSCLSLPFGIVSYINTFVAQYDGAEQPRRVAAAVWQGLYFAILAGAVLMLAIPWSETLFSAIGHAPELARLEAIYFRWLCVGAIPALMSAVLSAFFSGRGETFTVLSVNIACVSINAVLDLVFIFGWGPIPEWGIAGSAMTDVLGNVFAVLIFCGLLCRGSVLLRYPFFETFRPDGALIKDLFVFGGPSGLQMLIDVAGFAAFMMIVGHLGEAELAATNMAFNLNTLAFIPVIGLGIAVSTLVGQRIGEGRPELASVATWHGFQVGGGYMLVFGLIYVLLPDLLMRPYAVFADPTEFAATRETVTVLLRFVAIYSFFDAMAIIFGSAIRGAGDTRFSMFVGLFSATTLLVLPTYWLYHTGQATLFSCWTICAGYVIFLGFAYLGRFLQGKWRAMNVIHRGESARHGDSQPA